MERQMLYRSYLEQVEYIIEFKIINNKILIKIKENNDFVPYTYEGLFSYNDFIEHHQAFKSCSNVEDILPHLLILYEKNKIYIDDIGHDDCRYMTFDILFISLEVKTEHFELNRKMVKNKNQALIALYQEQKRYIEKIKKLEELIHDNENSNNNDLLRRNILEILSSNINIDMDIFDDYL